MPKLFPVSIILLNLSASLVYAALFDFKRATYWLASAVIIWTVTF